MPTPADILAAKAINPTPLTSAEWEQVDAEVRENSVFMATVSKYKTLQSHRDQIGRILEGNASKEEALRKVREYIKTSGYTPTPGTEGTIQDLSTDQRQRLVLEMNTAQCREKAYRESMRGSVAYPAQRLIRVGQRRAPRDWSARWQTAASEVGYEGVSRVRPYVALLESPVWAALSRFGLPYPPYDYNSGMGVEAVGYDEAVKAGLLADVRQDTVSAQPSTTPPRESLNADLSTSVAGLDPDLVADIKRQMQSCVEIEGDRVYYTDPNGTKPVHYSEAAKVICGPKPPGIPDTQAQAIVKFVEDQRHYDRNQRGVQGYATQEEYQALRDAVQRIIPTDDQESGVLYRGLGNKDKHKAAQLVDRITEDGYSPLPSKIVDSWSTSKRTAERFARNNGDGQIILVCDRYRSGHRIDGVVRALHEQGQLINAEPTKPHTNEGEVLFAAGTKMQVTKVVKGNPTYVYVEEL